MYGGVCAPADRDSVGRLVAALLANSVWLDAAMAPFAATATAPAIVTAATTAAAALLKRDTFPDLRRCGGGRRFRLVRSLRVPSVEPAGRDRAEHHVDDP